MDLIPAMAVLLALLLAAALAVLAHRGVAGAERMSGLDVSRQLGLLQAELGRLARAQEELRRDVHAGWDASRREIQSATIGVRGDLSMAQRALAEVKALEQGRARQLDRAADSLQRLEAVVAGSGTRGAAGESILARALGQLPPELLAVNVAFGSKVVEYALRLPGGRLLPIDSKWTSAAALERLLAAGDPAERRRASDHVLRDLRLRVREMSKYLDPERTLALALLAVPDAVPAAAPEIHAEGHREGVLVVPYSLVLPYVLAFYRLAVRFTPDVDSVLLGPRLDTIAEALRRADEEIEGRLSRGLVQVENARDALRQRVSEARAAAEGLRAESARAEQVVPGASQGDRLDRFGSREIGGGFVDAPLRDG